MRLSELVDRKVVTESGESLGRAFDVRAERRGSTVEITGLVVGRRGFFERRGIGPSRGEAHRGHKVWKRDLVHWEAAEWRRSGSSSVTARGWKSRGGA